MRFNKPQVKTFFDLLQTELNKHHIMPSRIFNADEMGVPTVPTKLPKVLAFRGLSLLCATCFYIFQNSYVSRIPG